MSGYIGNIPTPQATQTRDTFTATSGQTSFATSGYTPGFLDVFLNGVHLVNGTDYTASNGSDVVLTTGATTGDNLEVVAYTTFQTGDFVPTSGGTFSGNVAVNGNLTVDTNTLFVDAATNNVGIGVSSPNTKLHITGNLTIENGVSNAPFIDFVESGDNTDVKARIQMDQVSGTAGQLLFYTEGGGTLAERARIDSSGNVGIGLTNPGVPLHVKGFNNGNVMIVDATGTAANYIFDVRDDGTSVMRVDPSGNLLVGSTTTGLSRVYAVATGNFHALRGEATTAGYVGVYGGHSVNGGTGYTAYFFNSGSSTGLYMSNTAAWQSISDARMKENVRDLDTTERLMQLRPVDYLWKHQATSDDPDRRNLGFIAQEVQQVFPELVSTSPDGKLGVEYTGLIAPLVKAIQEQQAIIEALEARISALEGEPA